MDPIGTWKFIGDQAKQCVDAVVMKDSLKDIAV
jgi:hypothetical protein